MRIGLGAVSLSAIALLWTAIPRGKPGVPTPPSIVFLGNTRGIPLGDAGFRIHNRSSNAIFLQWVEVQTLELGSWKTRSESGVFPNLELNKGRGYTLICEPGQDVAIQVPWPWESPWRIRLTYQPERTSASWLQRSGMVLRLRNLDGWKSRFWDPPQATEGSLVFDPRPDAAETLGGSPTVELNLDWKPGVQYFRVPGVAMTPKATNRTRIPTQKP
ncbi:MAG: hypothetical protein JNL10_02135 [Verrucomicrobiales bacterium]|nr:hypothetical protein [Verrucomicrobiales bacterium]